MKKKLSLSLIGLALVLTCVLAGCGGDKAVVTTTKTVEVPATKTTDATTLNTADITTTKSGDVTTIKSGDVTITTSPDITPFPDIPVYSGARATSGDYSALTGGMSSISGGVKAEWHYYEIDASDVEAAQKYYESAMKDNGWDKFDMSFPSVAGSTYSMYMKGTTTSAIIMTFANPTNKDKAILALCKTSM